MMNDMFFYEVGALILTPLMYLIYTKYFRKKELQEIVSQDLEEQPTQQKIQVKDGFFKRVFMYIYDKTIFSFILRLLLEGYLELCKASIPSVIKFHPADKQAYVALVLGYVQLVSIVLLPTFLLLYILKYWTTFKDKEVEKRFGSLYSELNTSKRDCLLYNVLFLVRRLLLIIQATLIPPHSNYLNIVILFCTSYVIIYYLIMYKPFELPIYNNLEIFNEIFILVILYHLLLFTDFITSPTIRTNAGWVIIVITLSLTLINLIVIGVYQIIIIHKMAKRYYRRWQSRRRLPVIKVTQVFAEDLRPTDEAGFRKSEAVGCIEGDIRPFTNQSIRDGFNESNQTLEQLVPKGQQSSSRLQSDIMMIADPEQNLIMKNRIATEERKSLLISGGRTSALKLDQDLPVAPSQDLLTQNQTPASFGGNQYSFRAGFSLFKAKPSTVSPRISPLRPSTIMQSSNNLHHQTSQSMASPGRDGEHQHTYQEGNLGVEEELKVSIWDQMNQIIQENPHSGSEDYAEKEDDWDDIVLKAHQESNLQEDIKHKNSTSFDKMRSLNNNSGLSRKQTQLKQRRLSRRLPQQSVQRTSVTERRKSRMLNSKMSIIQDEAFQ